MSPSIEIKIDHKEKPVIVEVSDDALAAASLGVYNSALDLTTHNPLEGGKTAEQLSNLAYALARATHKP